MLHELLTKSCKIYKAELRGESNSLVLYNFRVRQFMLLSSFCVSFSLLFFLYLFLDIPFKRMIKQRSKNDNDKIIPWTAEHRNDKKNRVFPQSRGIFPLKGQSFLIFFLLRFKNRFSISRDCPF